MRFKDILEEAVQAENKQTTKMMRILIPILWFIPGAILGIWIGQMVAKDNAVLTCLIALLIIVLSAWAITRFFTQRTLRNSRRDMERKITSRFPEGTTAEQVYDMADRTEELAIPGNTGIVKCNDQLIASVMNSKEIFYAVIPADQINYISVSHHKLLVEQSTAVAKDAQAAWDAMYTVACRIGRTDLLKPRRVLCAAMGVARERLIRELIDLTSLKTDGHTDVFYAAEKEATLSGDEDRIHTVKNFKLLYEAIMCLIYDSEDGWESEIVREYDEPAIMEDLKAFMESVPNACDADLICRICGNKAFEAFKWNLTGIKKFDHFPKAMWEDLDLGFGSIIRPLMETEWKFLK